MNEKTAYTHKYVSPLGDMLIAASGERVTGLWFYGARHFAAGLEENAREGCPQVIRDTVRWLDIYFSGKDPGFLPPLRYDSTPFRKAVCDIMLTIPYGRTMTYGQIARELARQQGREKVSAQAVGGAVGHNPISLLIPCHRVVGTGGSLTGYASGIDRKMQLLRLEGADMSRFFVPRKGTAL